MTDFKLPKTDMTSEELADELILRLNSLLVDPDVASLIYRMMNDRLSVPARISSHATIQVNDEPGSLPGRNRYAVGFVGLLNGLVGAIDKPDSTLHGWGFIAGVLSEGKLIRFERTKTYELNLGEENAD